MTRKQYEYCYDVHHPRLTDDDDLGTQCVKNASVKIFDSPDYFNPEKEEYASIHLEDLAGTCAKHFYEWHDGHQDWEHSNELVFVLKYKGRVLGEVTAELEMEPTFGTTVNYVGESNNDITDNQV
jgi:hypothetical protein